MLQSPQVGRLRRGTSPAPLVLPPPESLPPDPETGGGTGAGGPTRTGRVGVCVIAPVDFSRGGEAAGPVMTGSRRGASAGAARAAGARPGRRAGATGVQRRGQPAPTPRSSGEYGACVRVSGPGPLTAPCTSVSGGRAAVRCTVVPARPVRRRTSGSRGRPVLCCAVVSRRAVARSGCFLVPLSGARCTTSVFRGVLATRGRAFAGPPSVEWSAWVLARTGETRPVRAGAGSAARTDRVACENRPES
jgi:hypothetical protein